MSWMTRTQRFGSRVDSEESGAARASVHEGLAARPDFGLDPVERLASGEKEGVEIGPAPGEIGDLLRRAQLTDEVA